VVTTKSLLYLNFQREHTLYQCVQCGPLLPSALDSPWPLGPSLCLFPALAPLFFRTCFLGSAHLLSLILYNSLFHWLLASLDPLLVRFPASLSKPLVKSYPRSCACSFGNNPSSPKNRDKKEKY
jgi:hypothetical protein